MLTKCNEVSSSNAMELEGLKQCLKTLETKGMTIQSLTTDRHMGVKAFIRELGTIIHYFDVWHVAKGIALYIIYSELEGGKKSASSSRPLQTAM